MKYEKLAKDIMQNIGGEENVSNLVHCATRLRFNLKDNQLPDKEKLKSLEGVLTVVESAGQFQVVIGNDVSHVYQEIKKTSNLDHGNFDSADPEQPKEKLMSIIFAVISGSLSPLLPAMAGAGILKAFLTLFISFGWISAESGTYLILAAAANAVFYFLPIFLGITASIKFGANPYVGGVIGASLMEPNFTGLLVNGDTSSFLGIPVVLMDYSATVFPVFVAIWIFSYVEKWFKKIIHKELQTFLVPLLCLVIIVPLTAMIFGPFGVYIGNAIADAINYLMGVSGLLTGAVIGGLIFFLVVFGLHWGIIPIVLANLTNGTDPILAMWAASNFAMAGVALAVFLKSKKEKALRSIAASSTLSLLLAGVSEPTVYGILLRYKRTIPYVIIAGAIGGAINGAFHTYATAFVFQNVFSIGAFEPVGYYLIGIVVSMAMGLILTILFGYQDKKEVAANEQVTVNTTENEKNMDQSEVSAGPVEPILKKEVLLSPLTGELKSLTEVPDPAFADGAMGKGIAIVPTDGQVLSPVNGTVGTVLKSGHAVILMSENGGEILIHVGINTVQLKGQHFTPRVKAGDQVKQGDLLIDFDLEKITEAGYNPITPIIISNTADYLDVIETTNSSVTAQDKLLTLVV
ncbi:MULTISPECIES: beta-glucoside-specific PTS transporter subunit IIABC [Paenibacillus]|uniref:PTS system beta-glucosides-specific IIC component n=1 Tax=Paenibacillus pabuli TaxID=1472 RepID=A0A855XV89_9BACL|nr:MULTISPECIES: beta-glucoside-specific PTS transporter subunit IIABC [Paenibacillus]PWW38860.1 PTS system beta-glucosides-specific IIC component [Paenibacillus pabuli]PXW06045.1 PTS system beta-glucosides-specific IIC component [Paenibacillus taichungensis]